MKKEDKDTRIRHSLLSMQRYGMFFLLMAFVITCCMVLFLETMEAVTGLSLTEGDIEKAAKVTFLNVIFLSLLCTVIDGIRRRRMVDRPVRQIIGAAEKIMEGDFSVRIPPLRSADPMGGFDVIAEYFNKAAAELGNMETLRTDFIANVSHELKTPLAVIQNYGTMLQQTSLTEEDRIEYAKGVTDASQRLADLVTNILKLNRLEHQQIFPAAERFDLGEQLCQCLLSFENAWEEKKLDIDVDMEERVYVESDQELLSLVWNNLFSNAVKFTEPGGSLSLRLKTEQNLAVVEVADTGCGISREAGAHIFEKFHQGDTSHAVQGNGLGLSLVKRVVDIVGGDISVESEVGKGSIFTVKIERATDETG